MQTRMLAASRPRRCCALMLLGGPARRRRRPARRSSRRRSTGTGERKSFKRHLHDRALRAHGRRARRRRHAQGQAAAAARSARTTSASRPALAAPRPRQTTQVPPTPGACQILNLGAAADRPQPARPARARRARSTLLIEAVPGAGAAARQPARRHARGILDPQTATPARRSVARRRSSTRCSRWSPHRVEPHQ